MNLEFAALQENIEACEAQIAASALVIESMAHCLGDYEATSAATPRGLLRCATDGERADGRLAWVAGL